MKLTLTNIRAVYFAVSVSKQFLAVQLAVLVKIVGHTLLPIRRVYLVLLGIVTRIASNRAKQRLRTVSCSVFVIMKFQYSVVLYNVRYVVCLEFLCRRIVLFYCEILRQVERDIIISVAFVVGLYCRCYYKYY